MKKVMCFVMLLTTLVLACMLAKAEGMSELLDGLPVNIENQMEEENLFGELKGMLEEEQRQEQTKQKQLAFNCEALNSLGECTLYKTRYSFRDGCYSVYLFSKIDKDVITNMVALNRDERYYDTELFEEDGIQYYLMTQYGENGIKLAISPDFLGYTLVMIDDNKVWLSYKDDSYTDDAFMYADIVAAERQPRTEGYDFPWVCHSCHGVGECIACSGQGKCQSCEGPGYDLCSICSKKSTVLGSCPHCDGIGFRISGDYMRTCSACRGTGNCTYCDGKGYRENWPCTRCKGTDVCQTCKGNGVCPECNGKGQT